MKTQTKSLAILLTGGALMALAAFVSVAPASARIPVPGPPVTSATPAPSPAPAPAPVPVVLPAIAGGPSVEAAGLPASSALKITAGLSHPVLLPGKGREVYYEARISGNGPGQRRSPVQLALVLDRSGSMGGEKLEQTKAAACEVLSQLVEGDRFVVVTYDDGAQVVRRSTAVTWQSVEEAKAHIRALEPGGSTNLDDGVRQAASLMLADHQADRSVRRMVLLSDGQANTGDFAPESLFRKAGVLRQKGISLSTIGVGLDFNARLMEGMAGHGGGRFRFLENPAELARGFIKELELAARLVAADVKVILHPADGVRVEEVYGYQTQTIGGDVVLRLPDLASSSDFSVRARLSVDVGAGEAPALSVFATYADVAADRVRVATQGPVSSVRPGRDAAEVALHEDRTVLAEGINARGIADAQRAMELFDQGRREEALKQIDSAMGSVAVAHRDLRYGKLRESKGLFGELRSLFANSANALAGESTERGRRTHRKAIKELGDNNVNVE